MLSLREAGARRCAHAVDPVCDRQLQRHPIPIRAPSGAARVRQPPLRALCRPLRPGAAKQVRVSAVDPPGRRCRAGSAGTIPVLTDSHNSNQLRGAEPPPRATTRTPVRHVEIDADNAGRRLDNFLASELPGVPRSRLYRLLRRGEVRVDGGRARAERRLRSGEIVRLPPVDSKRGATTNRRALPTSRLDGVRGP